MFLVCLVIAAVSGLSLGLSLSVRALVPAALAIATLGYAGAPAMLGDGCSLTGATVCVALLDIAALFGLAARLGLIDHRIDGTAPDTDADAASAPQAGRT